MRNLRKLQVWNNDEVNAHLGESAVTLGKGWESLTPRLLAVANRQLSSSDVAGSLRVPRDLWDQWVSRGRRRLRQHLEDEYTKVFALWV